MAFIGRKTLKSERARMQQIDAFFLRVARVVLISYACFVFVVWLSERALWRIDEVTVVGTHAIPREEIVATARASASERFLFLIRRDNHLLYPDRALLARLTHEYPRIAEVSIERPSAHHLAVRIVEYAPEYLYCRVDESQAEKEIVSPEHDVPPAPLPEMASTTDTTLSLESAPVLDPGVPMDCYFADRRGYVFAPAPEYVGAPFLSILSVSSTTPESLPDPIGTFLFDSIAREKIRQFIAELDARALRTHTVVLYGDGDVDFRTNMPWTILWSITADPGESARNLGVVLESLLSRDPGEDDLRRIDLRFGNKVFYQ